MDFHLEAKPKVNFQLLTHLYEIFFFIIIILETFLYHGHFLHHSTLFN